MNAWLALTFIIVVIWNFTAGRLPAYLQPDVTALTIAFLGIYAARYHRVLAISIRQWLLLCAISITIGLVASWAKFVLIGA